MSTDWNVHCADCDVTHTFNDANHMLPEMRLLVKYAPAIAGLAPLMDESRDVRLKLGECGTYGDIEPAWFATHLGHRLCPISEYGGFDAGA